MKFNVIIITLTIVFSRVEALTIHTNVLVQKNCSEIYSKTVPRFIPYAEEYKVRNWFGVYKTKTRINYRQEDYVTHHIRAICCPGYEEYGVNLCQPLCNKKCDSNGVCVAPDTCKCIDGYKMDHNLNECKPECQDECYNGYCSSPNECSCNDGYRMVPETYTCTAVCNDCENLEYCVEPHTCKCLIGYTRYPETRLDSEPAGVCKAVCERECINSDCVEPNLCRCHKGYVKDSDDEFVCVPKCTLGCTNGFCTSPEMCTCYPGYKLEANSTHHCEPVCTDKCINAFCIAPNRCFCLYGYLPLGDPEYYSECRPHCNYQCINGECTAPDVCTCQRGHRQVNASTCEPVCTEDCIMGTCTAPDTCTCHEGYRLENGSKFACEPICEDECINGRCTAPNECTCDDGYEKKNATDDSSTCIVICQCANGYCNDSSWMCETCAEGYDLDSIDNSTICKPHCEGGCENGQCVEPQKCECNEYYLADNDTLGNPICVHVCGGDCVHGVCVQEIGACNCLYGWSGKYCEEPSSCAIVISENQPIYLQLNESIIFNESENMTNIEDPWIGPICNVRCLQEINNETNCVNQLGEEQSNITCFMDLKSLCNIDINSQSNEYKPAVQIATITIIVAVVSLLTTILIGTILIIKKKRREREPIEIAVSIQQVAKREEEREEQRLIDSEHDGISL